MSTKTSDMAPLHDATPDDAASRILVASLFHSPVVDGRIAGFPPKNAKSVQLDLEAKG
jgi:hypothetical protein